MMRTMFAPYPLQPVTITGKNLPYHLGYRPRAPRFLIELAEVMSRKKPETPPGTMKNKKVQTIYRESEAQTDPFDVDIIEPEDKGLEILTLGWLSWDNGLPAGMHEVEIIERARQKRAWEANLPEPRDQETLEQRKMIIEAIEINEWAFREDEIEFLNGMRMELAEKMMEEKLTANRERLEVRVACYTEFKNKEKMNKLTKVRNNFNRNMRKLRMQRAKVSRKYHRWNTVKEHWDHTSEIYGPLMMYGEDPRRRHERIHPHCNYDKVFKYLEILNHRLSDIPELKKPLFDYDKAAIPRQFTGELCIRETKWTETNLTILYEELKRMRLKKKEPPKPLRLKQRIPKPVSRIPTPAVEGIPDWEENLYLTSVFLQQTIKGRAIQAVMFEGRVRCQELIDELKSTHSLQKSSDDIKAAIRERVYGLQRQDEIDTYHERRKQEILLSLEGKTNGDMLDFLAKELLRLQDERLTHAFALLADRERHRREAAEAGRRQEEEQRRREHDEMFKQVVKVHQNSVDLYLEDVILQSRKWLAEREAREFIHNKAKKVDQAAHEAHQRSKLIEEFEIIGDLVHNFALPEAEKRLVRERLKLKQRNYLKTAHDVIYTNFEEISNGPRTDSGRLKPLPRLIHHKVPRRVPLKILRLKRMRVTLSEVDSESVSINKDERYLSSASVIRRRLTPLPEVEVEGENEEGCWPSAFSKRDVRIADDIDDDDDDVISLGGKL